MIPNRANEKKRHAQGFPPFDTAETAAYSEHGECNDVMNQYIVVKGLIMLNLKYYRKRDSVLKRKAAVFSFTTILESLPMCSKYSITSTC